MNKAKSGYTLSKSEFFMVCGLVLVIIVAVFINYLFVPAWNKISETMTEYDNENAIVTSLRNEYAKINDYRAKEKGLDEKLTGLHANVPEYFSEEELISTVDKTAETAKLDVQGISFAGMQNEESAGFLSSLKLAASGTQKKAAASAQSSEKDAEGEKKPAVSSVIRSERAEISFSGGYGAFSSFMKSLEKETRKLFFRDIVLSRSDDGTINGSITMLAFSTVAPQTDEKDAKPYPGYDYSAPLMPGKKDPFETFEGYTGGKSSPTGSTAPSQPDFYVILNTYDDNANKIIMGKYPLAQTEITSDTNGTVAATLKLTMKGTECSYEYALDGSSYFGSFTPDPASSGLSVNILSRARKSADDRVGMTLSVTNETGRAVTVHVNNDDRAKPRFALGTTTGKVQLSK